VYFVGNFLETKSTFVVVILLSKIFGIFTSEKTQTQILLLGVFFEGKSQDNFEIFIN
jgi:hypothetical protein